MIRYLRKITYIVIVINLFAFLPTKLLSQEIIKNEEGKFNIPSDYLNYAPEHEYILGENDLIYIQYNNNNIRDKLVTIKNDGTIFTNRLRRIYIKGLTINELTNLLNKRYEEFFINPNINIEIVRARPIRIYITGEVISPGSYLLGTEKKSNEFNQFIADENNIKDDQSNFLNKELNREENRENYKTLFDAIRIAQGITLYSDLQNIEVIRKIPISKGGGKIKTSLNFLNFIETGSDEQNINLMDGDTIIINRSDSPLNEQFRKATRTNLQSPFNKVFISGRVENPGMKLINKTASLNDLILLSGSSKPLKGFIYLIRFNNDGTLTRKRIRYRRNARSDTKNNPILRSGDIVSVDSNFY